MANFVTKSDNATKNSKKDDRNFKSIKSTGVGFINELNYIRKQKDGKAHDYLVIDLALQQGEVKGDNYDNVSNIKYHCFVTTPEVQKVLIGGFFDDDEIVGDTFNLTYSPDKTVTCAVTLSGVNRVDIINQRITIHSNMIGLGYLAVDGNMVYKRERNQEADS